MVGLAGHNPVWDRARAVEGMGRVFEDGALLLASDFEGGNDTSLPTIVSGALDITNAFMDVTFSEDVFTNNTGTGALTTGDFVANVTSNGGPVTTATASHDCTGVHHHARHVHVE